MKTMPPSTSLIMQADPKIVKKARRANAAYTADVLPGERDHDYLHQLGHGLQALRFLEFGRPSL